MYRVCCRGLRGCLWTVSMVVVVHLIWRTLLLLEGRGVLEGHGLRIPRIRLGRKPPSATIPLDFLLEQRTYCIDRPGLLAVALIPSAVKDAALRQETRQTWGSAPALGLPLGSVFLMGRPANREERRQVHAESLKYGDIVQGDYEDGQTAAKTLNGVLWLAMHCAMVPFTIHASDNILLDVFLLHSFLWEVLDAPEKQGMLFGMTSDYEPPVVEAESGWSLRNLRYMVPDIIETEVQSYPPYLEEGAWFGRTQAVAKLLGASGGVPLVSPSTMYITGLLANAAGLHKSPDLFNAWWRRDNKVVPQEIGMVLGWLNSTLAPPRTKVWEMLKLHHNFSAKGQVVKRDVVVNLTMNPNKRPAKLVKYTGISSHNKFSNTSESVTRIPSHQKRLSLSSSTKIPLSKANAVIPRKTFYPTDPKVKQAYLLRKKQLKKMMRSTHNKSKVSKNKLKKKKKSKGGRKPP